jgi:hypothetical protein
MICPIPSDMICPTPPIFRGETWDVLCGQMAREYHQTQLYFSAVTLLPRQTKAMGGKVEIDYFGVSLRYFSGGEALAGGQVRRGGLDGNSFYTGTEAQDAMVYDGPTGRNDGWCGVASCHQGNRRHHGPHRRSSAHSGPTPPVPLPTLCWRTYRDPVEHPISKFFYKK